MNEKDLVIRQLKLALDEMIAASIEENNSTLNDAAKQILTDNKTLANKQSKLQEEIIDTSDRLYKDRKANYSNEAKLRKRKFKMAGELHNWIIKYDQDMQWRQVSRLLLDVCRNSYIFLGERLIRIFAVQTEAIIWMCSVTLLKKRLRHTFFPENFANFIRASFFEERLR